MYFRGYQKFFYVLLCEDDRGTNEGKGNPVKRASYADCEFLEATGIFDKQGREIFEGDIVKAKAGGREFQGLFEEVPDMFRSRRLHPLHHLLARHGVPDEAKDVEFEILGNQYEQGGNSHG